MISLTMMAAATQISADFTVQELFAVDDPDIRYLERFRKLYGADDDAVILLISADDPPYRPEVLRLVQQLTDELGALKTIRQVDSLTTITDLGQTADGAIDTRPIFRAIPEDLKLARALWERARHSPLARRRVISPDGKLMAIVARMAAEMERADDLERVCGQIDAVVRSAKLPPGTRIQITGVPWVRTEAVALIEGDQLRFLPLGSALTLLTLLLLYRSWHGVLIPAVSISLATAYTVGLMALTKTPLDILSNVLPLLVMVYAVADAVHMLGRIHERWAAGASRKEAIVASVRHLGLACLLTSTTTAVGFGSLMTSGMTILRRFGLFAAAGVMLAYLVAMVVVPLGALLLSKQPIVQAHTSSAKMSRLLARLASFVGRRPAAIVLAGIVVGVSGITLGLQVPVDNYLLGIYGDDSPTVAATKLTEDKLFGVVTLQVAIEGKPGSLKQPAVLRAIEQARRWVERRPEVTSTTSAALFVKELHRAMIGERKIPDTAAAVSQLLLLAEGDTGLERFCTFDYSKGRLLISLRDIGARRYLALAEQLDQQLPTWFASAGVRTRVTGTSLIAYRGINQLVIDLLISLSVALLIIAMLLMAAFRSVRVGVISLVPNVIPLACGLAFMYVVGMRLEPTTVMIYCIALGIAVDDTIHFIARYREECIAGADVQTAVATTLQTAGRAMVVTSVVLIIGFTVTLVSAFPATQRFGVLACVILAAALVTDLLITPACMLLMKPWAEK